LKASGQTEDQIDAFFVPRTPSERRKKLMEDAAKHAEEFEQMKEDIAFLKEEVQILRKAAGIIKDDKPDEEKESSRS
jgi:hypothetical protein